MTPSFDSSNIPALYKKFRDLVDYPDSPFTCSEQTGDDGAQYEVYSYRIASYTDFLRDHALWSRGIMFRVKPTLDLVCLPQFKFFNVSECPFTMGLENEPIKLILNKLDGCFPLRGPLNLWNGGTIPIGRVVKRRLTPKLMGMSNGQIVPCEVVEWKDNGVKNNWVDVTFTYTRKGYKTNKLRVTTNHHIKINGEFNPVSTLKVDDTLQHYDPTPDPSVLHLIRSAMLGDGSISKNGKKYSYQEVHSEHQLEYLKFLQNQMGECATALHESFNRNHYGNSKMFHLYSKSYNSLKDLRQEWYPNGKKQVPLDLSWMDDFSVAKWYMDDGSIVHQRNSSGACAFSTNGFVEMDVNRLASKLAEMYGVSCVVYFSKGWCIRVNNAQGSIDNLWMKIAPYIPSCMRYKLPSKYHNTPLPLYTRGTQVFRAIDVRVTAIQPLENSKKTFWSGRKGFDIQTTTGNYFINGVLVHNSLISHFLDLSGNLRLKSKTSLHSTQAVSAMAWLEARPAAKNALAALDRAGYTTNMEWISLTNRIVIAYPEDNLVVLNVVNRMTGEVILPGTDKFKFDFGGLDVVEVFDVANTLADLLPVIENGTDMEGYVVQFANGTISKQKINFYVLRHQFLDAVWSDKKLFELCLHDKVDDVINLFNTNPIAVDRINTFRALALKTLNSISSQVEIFYNTNKHLDRKSYAILGQKEMNSTFSLCMNLYLGRENSYADFIMKYFDSYVTPNLPKQSNLPD